MQRADATHRVPLEEATHVCGGFRAASLSKAREDSSEMPCSAQLLQEENSVRGTEQLHLPCSMADENNYLDSIEPSVLYIIPICITHAHLQQPVAD